MDNITHFDMGSYFIREEDEDLEMPQGMVHFDDNLLSSLYFLPSATVTPIACQLSQSSDAITSQHQRPQLLQPQQCHQQQQMMLLPHWKLLHCQLESSADLEAQQQGRQQDECDLLSHQACLSQLSLFPQNQSLQWLFQGSMYATSSIQLWSSCIGEEATPSSHDNSMTCSSPSIIGRQTNSEVTLSTKDQFPFDIEGTRSHQQSVSITVEGKSIHHDKLNTSTTAKTTLGLVPVVSSLKTTTTMCELQHVSKPQNTVPLDPESDGSKMLVKKKRARRNAVAKDITKLPQYQCGQFSCKVVCSSIPSLARHTESHKWKGSYAPIRCEGCRHSLSNEFSVQRHILNSKPKSPCYQMRVYSVMKSRTEVETTVRFYPKRPHGKKTVVVNLENARAKYYAI